MTDRMARGVPSRVVTCPECGQDRVACMCRSDVARYMRCMVCGVRWEVPIAGARSAAPVEIEGAAHDHV